MLLLRLFAYPLFWILINIVAFFAQTHAGGYYASAAADGWQVGLTVFVMYVLIPMLPIALVLGIAHFLILQYFQQNGTRSILLASMSIGLVIGVIGLLLSGGFLVFMPRWIDRIETYGAPGLLTALAAAALMGRFAPREELPEEQAATRSYFTPTDRSKP